MPNDDTSAFLSALRANLRPTATVVHTETRMVLLQQTDAIHHIIELLADSNTEIRKMADQVITAATSCHQLFECILCF